MGCIPSKPGRKAFKEGKAAHDAYLQNRDLNQLQKCIDLYDEALQSYPADHHKYALMHSTIANAKFLLGRQQGGPTYKETSAIITSAKTAYQWYDKQTPKTSNFYTTALNLGTFYRHRFELEQHRQDGQDAIDCLLQVQVESISHPLNPPLPPNFEREALIELGVSEWIFCDIRSRTKGTVPTEYLDQAIKHLEKACAPGKGRPDARPLQNLGHAYATRHRLTGFNGRDDIDRAIDYYEQALEAAGELPQVRIALARTLLVRNAGSGGDIQAAIQQVNTVLDSVQRNTATTFDAYYALGLSYKAEYERTKALDDLQKSADAFQSALNTRSDDQEVAFNLAVLRQAIVEHQGDDASPEQIDEAKAAISDAIKTCARDRQKSRRLKDIQSYFDVPQKRGTAPARMGSLRYVGEAATLSLESPTDVDGDGLGEVNEEPENFS